MKCSYNWLKEFVNLDGITPKELARALTMSGSVVEKITELGGDVENTVVGRVISIGRHPDADRLFVCSVDVGDGTPRQIITGADNVFDGAVVPVALDGASLPCGKKIKTGKMRGLESQGMLCGGDELGFDGHDQPGAETDGILILDDTFTVGTDIADALMMKDFVLELEITNNRPDCLSVIGLAREAAAALRVRPAANVELCGQAQPAASVGNLSDYITVTVENQTLCPRYSARVAADIKISPSPMWMRRRLRACGVRPINNIVDITNYVMLETGQPMHAFDHALVRDGQIIVRTARDGEVLETLDGKKRTLTPDMLVIADSKDAVAVAGVMGGAGSEVTEKTQTIVFESANFNGPSVRKTALALALRTDSSSRFEKGISPATTTLALERACQLVAELGAGTPVLGVTDVSAPPEMPVKVSFTHEQINGLLGVEIPEINGLLESLGFVAENGVAVVPAWRRDVTIWQDLAEEAARLYGYDNIPTTMPPSKNQGWLTREQALRAQLHELCVSLGFYEALTYSFIGPADLKAACMSAEGVKVIGNPLGEEHSMMRTSLLPSFLDALSNNTAVRNPDAVLYELSKVYTDTGGRLPAESFRLIFGGYRADFDFFALKGIAETLIGRFCRKEAVFSKAEHSAAHPGRCASVNLDGRGLGVLGELHPSLGFPAGAAFCELDVETLIELAQPDGVFSQLPRFPAITRDLALTCPQGTAAADVVDAIRRAGGALLEDCVLFDVYAAKNSLAYRLSFRADDRTLTDEDADGAIKKVLKKLQNDLNVVIRS